MIVRGARDERSYSVVDATSDGTRIALSVYLSEASRGGAEVMHSLSPGDRVRLTQPLQDFPLRFGAPAYVLLAGGIGVTAIAGMAGPWGAAGADYRFVYCGRSRDAMAYLDELRAIHGDRLELHVGAEGTTLDVPDFIAGVPERAEVYLCGPIRLMDAVRRAWTTAGRSAPDLRFETFGNSGWFAPEAFRVSIPALGIETTVSRDQTLLEALEAAGADPLSDCRKGECGLCEALASSTFMATSTTATCSTASVSATPAARSAPASPAFVRMRRVTAGRSHCNCPDRLDLRTGV